MMMKRTATSAPFLFALLLCSSILLLGSAPAAAQDTASLTGTVIDAETGELLPGVSVLLTEQGAADLTTGASTDIDGTYRIENVPPGRYRVEIRFIGYETAERSLSLEAGQSRTLDIALAPSGVKLDAVVVSASRQPESVQKASASISVLAPKEIQKNTAVSSIEAIQNTVGVDMSQTGINQREVVLRGFNNAFSGATHVLTDYREASAPSLGVNLYSVMPNQAIDLERIEVVRGPSSALYGPGAAQGVVHFISKDPFDYPGAALSVSGGTQSLFSGEGRLAGTIGEQLGYKLTGSYTRAEDWELDPAVPADSAQLAQDFVFENRSAVLDNQEVREIQDGADTDFKLLRDSQHESFNVNGLLQYRFSEGTRLSLGGGYSSFTGTTLSGVGTLQGDGFGYSYGQLRFRAGGLFAQAYLNRNDAGASYVYGTGQAVVDNSTQYNAQAQYSFALFDGDEEVIVGADAELIRPDTEGTILGRNEQSDAIDEYGAYVQSSTALSSLFDLTLALRGDYNNVVDQVRLSPRAALVATPADNHSIRVSYNRAFSSPGTNSLFLDIPAQTQALGGGFELVFQGRGAAEGFTFDDFRQSGRARFSLPSLNPALQFGDRVPVSSVPLQAIYGVATSLFDQALSSEANLPPPLEGLNEQQLDQLATALTGLTPLIPGQASTSGQLGIPDDSERGYRTVEGPVDVDPLEQTTTQTFELGYKGQPIERVSLAVDAYYETKENFVGPLLVESPLVYVPHLSSDLGATLAPVIEQAAANDEQTRALLDQMGLTPAQAAGLIGQLVGSNFAGVPVAVVQPDQQVLPGGGGAQQIGGLITYRNFGNVSYYGADVSLKVFATERLSLFGNASLVSDDFFDSEELDEENEDLVVALNAPQTKAKGGFSYDIPEGFSFSASGRYVKGFPVRSGPYVGRVEDYFLLDAGVGYDVGAYVPGLSFDLSGRNLLDNEHREFVGAPQLGLMVIGQLTYQL